MTVLEGAVASMLAMSVIGVGGVAISDHGDVKANTEFRYETKDQLKDIADTLSRVEANQKFLIKKYDK